MGTIFITGATRGIGAAIARRLAGPGQALYLVGRDAAALESVCADCREAGAEADALAGDLTDAAFRAAAFDGACARFGEVDVLVNNAGISYRAPVQEADLDRFAAVLELNLNAVIHLCRLAAPGMVARRRGAIVNLSSLSGRNTDAGNAIYAATKHALNGFTGSLFEDLRDFDVKVAAIMPGFVATDMTARLDLNANDMIRADDVAEAVAYVLSSSPHCCPTEIVLRPQRRP